MTGKYLKFRMEGSEEDGMSGKSAVVSVRRLYQRVKLVSCRVSVVHYSDRDSSGNAVL